MVLKVYTEHPAIQALPPQLDGLALDESRGSDHRHEGWRRRRREPHRPFKRRFSSAHGRWRYDLANGYCCGGTLLR